MNTFVHRTQVRWLLIRILAGHPPNGRRLRRLLRA